MKVRFIEKGHKYESIPAIKWTSVTKVVEKFCPEFDEIEMSEKCSLNQNSRWFDMEPSNIRLLWEKERQRSIQAGHWYHNMMENKALKAGSKLYRGHNLKVIPPIMKPGYKLAPNQLITEGIYPEHFVYNEHFKICGQSDLTYRYDNYVDIDDYKTNKELKFHSYGYNFGEPQMMTGIMSHLEDCNFNHYTVQLSIYMKLILLKNPDLKPGRMRIYHIEFELEGEDKYGFPILKRTKDNDYIVKSGTWHTVPYLKKEMDKLFKIAV